VLLDAPSEPALNFGLHPTTARKPMRTRVGNLRSGFELVNHGATEAGDPADLRKTENLFGRYRSSGLNGHGSIPMCGSGSAWASCHRHQVTAHGIKMARPYLGQNWAKPGWYPCSAGLLAFRRARRGLDLGAAVGGGCWVLPCFGDRCRIGTRPLLLNNVGHVCRPIHRSACFLSDQGSPQVASGQSPAQRVRAAERPVGTDLGAVPPFRRPKTPNRWPRSHAARASMSASGPTISCSWQSAPPPGEWRPPPTSRSWCVRTCDTWHRCRTTSCGRSIARSPSWGPSPQPQPDCSRDPSGRSGNWAPSWGRLAMLKVCEALRDHVKALLKENAVSWKVGYAEPNP